MHSVLFKALAGLFESDTFEDIQNVIESYIESLGFPYYGYQYWPTGPDYGQPGFTGVVASTYPDAWENEYQEKGYFEDDPVFLFAKDAEGAIRWSDIPLYTPVQRELMDRGKSHGLADGVVAVEWDDDRNRTSIVVAGPEGVGNYTLAMETLPQLLPALAACFYKAHQIEVRLPKLTPREREVFVFWRRGTARKEIAARLHISERSVYRHLNELREKVNLSGLDIRRPGRNQNN